MSKKIISILLAVVMILTTVFGGMTVSAEGITNYVGDGGFENTTFQGTIPNFGNGGATQEMTWGRFSSGVTRLEIETDANGNKYLKSGVTADGKYIRGMGQILNLPAGDYILTFIAKSDAGEVFSVGVYPTSSIVSDNPAIEKITLDATDYWKEYKVEFTVTADGKYNLIIGGNTNGNGNIRLFYLDDVAVYAKDSIINIEANATVGGTVTGGAIVAKGETLTLTATAKSGYTFAGWSDGETAEVRTVTATANATYTANFTKNGADFVPNGDFESEDWALSDYWNTLSGNAAFLETADPADATNTVAYAKGANAATSMVSKNTVILKQGNTYVIEFESYMASAVTGNGRDFYRVGFIKPGSATLSGSSFVESKFKTVYNNTISTELGTWKKFTYKYTHNSADTEANLVLGMYNHECTSDWYLDNIVAYDEADLCQVTVSAEKGGSVEGAKAKYFVGDVLTLTATAKSGYSFAGWSDGETAATRTVVVTGAATYLAKFATVETNLIANGDFEDDNWSVEDAWNTVADDDNLFKKGEEANGNTYAYATPETRNSLATDVITVKPGEKYILEFDSYFVDSGKTLKGDTSGFYRYGFIEGSKTDLSGGAFTALAGNNYNSFSPAAYQDNWFGTWQHKTAAYTNTGDKDVQVKVVIGYFNDECGYEWRVDNVRVYNKANALNVAARAENGTATKAESKNAYIIKGDVITVTATPEKEEFEFVGWFKDGSTEILSTDETYTFVAEESITVIAKYNKVYPPVYNVVNGDFEASDNFDFATNITGTEIEGVWAKVGTGVNMFNVATKTESDPDFVGNSYAVATVPSEGYVRTFGQFVTLKANTEYTLEFAAKSNVLVGEQTRYSPVHGAVIKRMSGSHGVNTVGNAKNVLSDSSYATISADGEWHRYSVTFNSGDNTKVAVAFGGNITATAGMYFAVDNVVLKESTISNVSDFENGVSGWTMSDGATMTTANVSDTALASFGKYLGSKIGVLNPIAEGDEFISPAFETKVGETYDVVIYTRHNSVDDTRGIFKFTANGTKENLTQASYGVPTSESEYGKYENDNGFLVNPIAMGGDAKYHSSTFNKLVLTFTATAETHNIKITAVNPVSVFVDGFVLYAHSDAVELAKNSITYKGVAIRTTDIQGLRFKNSISVDALTHLGNYAKVVEYGTLAIKEEYKNGEITVGNLTDGKYDYTKSSGTTGCRLKVGVAYKESNGTDVVFSEDLYNKDFTGVLIGIGEEDYSANYVTRVYAKVQFADGSFTYVYGDEQTANITAVAEHIVANGLETQEVRDYLNTNILSK